MKKVLSFILVLSLCLSFVSCVGDYKKNALVSAAEKISVSYKDAGQDGYAEFIDKLDSFAAKLTYEIYSDSNMQSNVCISPISVYIRSAIIWHSSITATS